MQLADSQERHAQLDERVIDAERKLAECREQQRSLERQAQEADLCPAQPAGAPAELQPHHRNRTQQAEAHAEEQQRAQRRTGPLTDAAAQAGLQNALALKLEREQALGAKRSEYDDLTAKLRASDERRLQLERELDPLRQRITEFQLKEQAARLGFEQYASCWPTPGRSGGSGAVHQRRATCAWPACRVTSTACTARLRALGAVNLAALDELTTARERKQFLDAQSADLNRGHDHAGRRHPQDRRRNARAAVGHLRHRQRALWPHVPRAVRWRQGPLVITGDEILDSGVQVMAQPPGKKNQTIHLLSGGEKALTAIALVFAIFQLNPAPFCLLDEVDAPLDDANTERYAKLVSQHEQRNPVPVHQPQQDRHGNGRATDWRDHAGAGRFAHRGSGHGIRHRDWPNPSPGNLYRSNLGRSRVNLHWTTLRFLWPRPKSAPAWTH
jgi:chromosome segregation protein